LSQLWADQAGRDDARALLAQLYDRFTEAFDTPDSQDAKALLAALGDRRSRRHPRGQRPIVIGRMCRPTALA